MALIALLIEKENLNEIFFYQKMKDKDNFSYCGSSLNDICLYLK